MTEGEAMAVATENQAQAEAWGGDEGAYWAEHADDFDRSVAAYHEPLLDAAAITADDRVLDIGCGNGQTTLDAARRASDGWAVGVDLSPQMLDVARQRAARDGVENVSFERVDAQEHPFDRESFAVALSRTGTMFLGDPVAGFRNIARAVQPGGRLALLTWQPLSENEWIPAFATALAAGRPVPAPPPNAPGPFALSDPDRVRAILSDAGYVEVQLDGRRETMWFGERADDAHDFVLGLLGWMLRGADDSTRSRGIENLRETMAAHETADGVVFGSAAWIITARRP
jgi:SAM-dependent methyltransferase